MPTPHGARGGMAFSADELRVLRRALAENLHPALEGPGTAALCRRPGPDSRERVEDVQEMLRLAEAIDEAVREGGRLRAFLLAELVRYRSALPGSAPGYLERLDEAVHDGYVPDAEDLASLRRLAAQPCGPEERARRTRLKSRCQSAAEADVRERLEARAKSRPTGRSRGLELLIGGAAAAPSGGTISMNARDIAHEPADPADRNRPDEALEAEAERDSDTDAESAEQTRPKPGPASKAQPKTQPKTPAGNQPKPQTQPGHRAVPTPADIFPGGVRRTG